MKNRKLIVSVVTIIIVIILIVGLVCYSWSKKQKGVAEQNVLKSNGNEIEKLEENITATVENEIQQEENNEKQEDNKIQEDEEETVKSIEPKEVTQTKEKSNAENIEVQKTKTENENKPKETITQTTKVEKNDEQPIKQTEETRKDKEEIKDNTPKCNHGNHKYYKTKAEAIATYDSELHKWSEKWTNYEIDDETYYKKCPQGYEIMSCPICEQWTINMYYN